MIVILKHLSACRFISTIKIRWVSKTIHCSLNHSNLLHLPQPSNIFVSDDDATIIADIFDWQSASIEPAFWYPDEVPDFASTPPQPSPENQHEPNSKYCAEAFEVCTQFHLPSLAIPRAMDQGLLRPFRYSFRTWKDGAVALRDELNHSIQTVERAWF
jgi:hypothetical protein